MDIQNRSDLIITSFYFLLPLWYAQFQHQESYVPYINGQSGMLSAKTRK
jgi:hypothetical protein